MKPIAIAAIATSAHGQKTDPPSSKMGLDENVTPMTPGTAAELARELKQELKVANEHWKTLNAKLYELVQVEEDEKKLLSAELNSLKADREKMKGYVVSVEKELGKLYKFVGDGNKEFYPEE